MDVQERESQPRRQSIKRPWHEDIVPPEHTSIWRGTRLPSVDHTSSRRFSLPQPRVLHTENIWREGPAKRARYEGHDYNSLPREKLGLNGMIPHAHVPHSIYNSPSRSSPNPTSSRAQQHVEGWGEAGEAGFQDSAPKETCPRCRRLMHTDLDLYSPFEDADSTRGFYAGLRAAAIGLTNFESHLLAGISPEARGVIRASAHFELSSTAEGPPIEEAGLRHTLDWLLERFHHVNELADRFMHHVPVEHSRDPDRDFTTRRNGSNVQDGLDDMTKRRIDAEQDEAYRSRDVVEDHISDAKIHTRRRSVTSILAGAEDFSPMRHPPSYHPPHPSDGGPNQRASIMNPPPAPNRQLPSPPGRSLPSPTSLSFPSPSAGSYGSVSQPPKLLQPSSLHHPSLSSYLPPIGSPNPPDALQAHSAALQHEVSVQKIALSSLQGEHNKLLAAFSRSQTRAAALEKKHAVSDGEINSLTEEKMRLQTQVAELEKDVEELGRSRDEFRQAAVQEGAQYVEIVKRATRLEELAGEERKGWNRLKAELERKIWALSGEDGRTGLKRPAGVPLRFADSVEISTSSSNAPSDLKFEPAGDSHPTSQPNVPQQDSTKKLEEEVRRLRKRCADVESTLRTVRDESRSMAGFVEALGEARKTILDKADRTLSGIPEE